MYPCRPQQLQEKVRRRAGGEAFWDQTVSGRKHLSVEDVQLINELRHIERKNSCPDVLDWKAKRKQYRDKKRANGEVGPNEKKMQKRKARGEVMIYDGKKWKVKKPPGLERKSSFQQLRDLTMRKPGLERKSSFQQLKDMTRRKKKGKGKDTVHPSEGLNATNVRRKTSKKVERAEKERLRQQQEQRLQEEEAARSWAASHSTGPA